jgi:hypothetical protein
MTELHVAAARIPDRDRLLAGLREGGLDAEPVGEIEITVACDDGDAADVGDEVFEQVQRTILSIGAPFVPIEHEGVIYIRPPVG